jgi:hypothetical protein
LPSIFETDGEIKEIKMSEIMISQWKEPFYLEEYDLFKGRRILEFLDSIVFFFFPEIERN